MSPYLVQTRWMTIAAYPFFYGLALVMGCAVFAMLARRGGVRVAKSVDLWAIIAIAVVLGARGAYAILHQPSLVGEQFIGDFASGGEALYGGMAGGIAAGILLAKWWRLPLATLTDAVSVALPIGIAVGRIGCLSVGCCHGSPCSSAWYSVEYPKAVDVRGQIVGTEAFVRHLQEGRITESAGRSAPVHAVPIYESGACVAIASVMYLLWRRRIATGHLLPLFLILYSAWRFVAEYFRVEPRIGESPFTIYQAISAVVCLGAMGAIAIVEHSHRTRIGQGKLVSPGI